MVNVCIELVLSFNAVAVFSAAIALLSPLAPLKAFPKVLPRPFETPFDNPPFLRPPIKPELNLVIALPP